MILKRVEGRRNPRAWCDSRLTVTGLHGHPSTPKPRPKRRVETPGDPWGALQPPGSSSPAYGTPSTANRGHLYWPGFYWLRKKRGRPAYSLNPESGTGLEILCAIGIWLGHAGIHLFIRFSSYPFPVLSNVSFLTDFISQTIISNKQSYLFDSIAFCSMSLVFVEFICSITEESSKYHKHYGIW